MAAKKSRGLGRGLNALIQNDGAESAAKKPSTRSSKAKQPPAEKAAEPGPMEVPVGKITANPYQPRQKFAEEALEELTASIKEMGILQPLMVRKQEGAATWQLIAGERRFRAAQRAGLKQVPVVVRELTDQEALEIALVENLQRKDLNIIEEAEGYHQLMDEFSLTQEDVAKRVGKARATVANALRLLTLSTHVRNMVQENLLSTGHAKAIAALELESEQDIVADDVLRNKLSVRETEKKVAARRRPEKSSASRKPSVKLDMPDDHVQYLTDKLHQQLGTSVRVHASKTMANGKKQRGRMEIDFYSNDDLDRLLSLLGLNEDL